MAQNLRERGAQPNRPPISTLRHESMGIGQNTLNHEALPTPTRECRSSCSHDNESNDSTPSNGFVGAVIAISLALLILLLMVLIVYHHGQTVKLRSKLKQRDCELKSVKQIKKHSLRRSRSVDSFLQCVHEETVTEKPQSIAANINQTIMKKSSAHRVSINDDLWRKWVYHDSMTLDPKNSERKTDLKNLQIARELADCSKEN